MRHRPKTIAEQGGLRVYLTKLGVDYDEFKRLKSTPGITKRAMRSLLSKGRKTPWSTDALNRWLHEYSKEAEETKHAEGSTDKH